MRGGIADRRHCRQRGCLCTHTAPCDAGWVELEPRVTHGVTYERVAPCPICRPNAAAKLAAETERTSRSVNA